MKKRFYVGNIPFLADEAELELFLQGFLGQNVEVKASIQIDTPTQRLRGFAYVDIETDKLTADEVVSSLDGLDFGACSLVVDVMGQ